MSDLRAHSPPSKSKRGPYKLPEKRRTMQDIRSLLISGLTYYDIMEQLHLEPRTFHRYLNMVYEDDRRLLAENINDTEILNQMAIAQDRWMAQRHDLLEMARDPEVDDNARVNCHHLAAEILAACLKLYTDGPAIVASRYRVFKSLAPPPSSSPSLQEEQEEEEDEETKRLRQERKIQAKSISFD